MSNDEIYRDYRERIEEVQCKIWEEKEWLSRSSNPMVVRRRKQSIRKLEAKKSELIKERDLLLNSNNEKTEEHNP